jgi:hypothetical protein
MRVCVRANSNARTHLPLRNDSGRLRAMRIQLPNGDVLIPDAEFREKAGGITARTGNNWDKQGCPHAYIGGFKYRPEREGLNWLASRIRRRNPRRNPKAA